MKPLVDIAFLNHLYATYNSPTTIDGNTGEKLKRIGDILDLLPNAGRVYCKGLGIIEGTHPNPLVNMLISSGRLRPLIHEESALASLPETIDLGNNSGAFFMGDTGSELCQRYQEETGYFYFNTLPYQKDLFDIHFITYNRASVKSWEFAKDLFRPHNSVVVADPYLFTDPGFKGLQNLLTYVKPNMLGRFYWITLVGCDASRPKSKGLYTIEQIHDRVQELKSALSTKALPIQIEAYIYNGRDLHDRYLITNNLGVIQGIGNSIVTTDSTKPQKEGTWVACRPFQQVVFNGRHKVYFEKIMQEKLRTVAHWIKMGSGLHANNPLLAQ